MYLIIFVHPDFIHSNSMPRFAGMISKGMRVRNHYVEEWTASSYFYNLPFPAYAKKWLGYLDQFIVFPHYAKRKIKNLPDNTLFVFSDQGLGPWVKLVNHRPHVIHCHDFLAQRSEKKELQENKLSFSGMLYQKWIRSGYKKGRNFISISYNTQVDLHRFLGSIPILSEVVYNGLNQDFEPGSQEKARELLSKEYNLDLTNGFILHVGGNQFYKNRKGVIKIYNVWRRLTAAKLPLLLIGPEPSPELKAEKDIAEYKADIHFIINTPNKFLKNSYKGASVLLFPSLEEGFGWPIAEAMASGCPVITTNKAPMKEVGKNSCYYISRMPFDAALQENWAIRSATRLNKLLNLSEKARERLIASGIENAKRFNTKQSIDKIEGVYKKVLKNTT